jgi:hypothetical protein
LTKTGYSNFQPATTICQCRSIPRPV